MVVDWRFQTPGQCTFRKQPCHETALPWETLVRSCCTVHEFKAELLTYLYYAAERVSINEHVQHSSTASDGVVTTGHTRMNSVVSTTVHVLRHASEPPGQRGWLLKAIIRCFLTLVLLPYTTATGLSEPAGVYGVKTSADWPLVYRRPWKRSDHFSKRAFHRLETRLTTWLVWRAKTPSFNLSRELLLVLCSPKLQD